MAQYAIALVFLLECCLLSTSSFYKVFGSELLLEEIQYLNV